MTTAADITLWRHIFGRICEDMGEILIRSAFSANIKERRDASCALFLRDGTLFAQAPHIPVHLGAMGDAVRGVLASVKPNPKDVIITNDPFRGGTHLPDITLVAPFCYEGTPLFYIACRAHHADIGGTTPGSLSTATSIHQEGLLIPPLHLVRGGRLQEDIMKILCSASRMPWERRCDIAAQLAAIRYAQKRLRDLTIQHGVEELLRNAAAQVSYTRRYAHSLIKRIPYKIFRFEDTIETVIGDAKICVTMRRFKKGLEFDFSGSSPQVPDSLNATAAVTRSCIFYVMIALLGGDVPPNAGVLSDVRAKLPERTIVNASWPAAVGGGNVETSQRIADTLLGVFSEAGFDVPAASSGTMANLSIGSADFAHYETIGGGAGASSDHQGTSAVHSHMTNTLNTPVEALEKRFPIEVVRYAIRRGSGGKGRRKGGDGLIRHLRLLKDAEVAFLLSRTKKGPWGIKGGGSGKPSRIRVKRQKRWIKVGGKAVVSLKAGDEICIETAGGGGWGSE